MSERVADALVLAFSEGVSLRVWAETGLLEREWELYRRLSGSLGRVLLVTYGGAEDRRVLARLGEGVGLVCNEGGLGAREYVESLPGRVVEELGPARTVVVKTNQMSGGEAALAVTRALRKAGKQAALVARGGYLWSQFAAWESGAASPAAVDAGEREGRLCRGADVVVGTTRQMVDDLAWRHGVAESRLAVVPNYVLLERASRPVERGAGTVLYVGRLSAQKRVDRLIDAMARLKPALREATRLSIVGEGPLEAELRERAERSGVRATFEGRMPHERVLERMRRCTVYAQASSYEGHPKTVIEAMSVGTPVLVADAPGLRGVVQHGASGLCVAPDAETIALALEGLLEDAAWRETLGQAAEAQARAEYGVEHVVGLEVGVYRRALACAAAHGEGADVARAVKWTPELLGVKVGRMVEGWERSLRGFSQRLEPRVRAEFLAALDGPLYHMQGEAAGQAEGGLHPKHRLMRYHDFFTDRIRGGERVIDLGCGVGALAASIAEHARASVTGMDWTQANLDRARKTAAERGLSGSLDYVLGDITKDRAAGRFDVVVLSNVLEHIGARVEMLRRWREWYAPSRVLVRVPAFDREWRVPWKKELGVEWRLDVTHETEYTRGQLEEEIGRAGMRVVECVTRWGEYWVVAEEA